MKKIVRISLAGILLVGTLVSVNVSSDNKEESINHMLEELKYSTKKMQSAIFPTIKFPERKIQESKQQTDYTTSDFYQDSEEILLARMLLGEAEGCSKEEKIAVAYTAINRIDDNKKWNGETLKEVILKPYQYSCFNTNLNNKLKNPLTYNSKEFLKCLNLSEEILSNKYKDPTNGATHYYNPNHPTMEKEPEWSKNIEKIGSINNSIHVFFKER